MKKKKIIGILALSLALAMGIGVGVSAANAAYKTQVSKGVIKYNDSIVIDGDSIGYWMKNSSWQLSNNWGENATITISDENIESDSLVEIYYKENCKDLVSKSKVTYIQVDDSVTVNIGKSSPTGNTIPIVIEAVHVTNPNYQTVPTTPPVTP